MHQSDQNTDRQSATLPHPQEPEREMAWTENLCLLSAPHQQLLSALRPHLLYITLSASDLHSIPKVLPPNSNGDLRPSPEALGFS